MASLFSTMITAVCITTNPTYQNACNKALDATTRQIGIRQDFDHIEDATIRYTETKVKANLSQAQLKFLAGGFAGYKIYRDRRVSFHVPTLGICDSISTDLSLDTYSLNLKWGF